MNKAKAFTHVPEGHVREGMDEWPSIQGSAPWMNPEERGATGVSSWGFTLVELLVSVAIFSAIAVVLYSCFRGGVISYRRIETEAESQQRKRHVFLKMAKDFKNIFYISNIPFEGYSDRTSFVTTITDRDKADINVGRISYYLEEGSKGQILIRKVESLKDALISLSITEEDIEEGASKTPLKEEPAILYGVTDLKFSYLYSNADKRAEDAEEGSTAVEYEWVDLWETENGLPLGIRIELSVSESKGSGQKKFYRQISIPADRLPDTILAELNVPVA